MVVDMATLTMDLYLTVDLEPDCPPYLHTFRGMETGADLLLDLFATEQIPATFFTTGDVARRYPEVIQRLVAQGHELGGHGESHRAFTRLSPAEAKTEIATSSATLRQFAPVTAFRAPYLLFPERYLQLLIDHGYRIDASQAKYKLDYYRSSPPTPLQRLPASTTSSVLRLPAAIRNPWLDRLRSPVVLFVHPWEFVDLRNERLRLDCRFRTGQPALDDLRAVIAFFQRKGARFQRISA